MYIKSLQKDFVNKGFNLRIRIGSLVQEFAVTRACAKHGDGGVASVDASNSLDWGSQLEQLQSQLLRVGKLLTALLKFRLLLNNCLVKAKRCHLVIRFAILIFLSQLSHVSPFFPT
ncbi:hypothetical protein ACH5RR_029525 [Cinchona calisaya]|uniref:Uncharacterized protein n=1 Tax=Cinchona calisaya TaxID=153742 RepID=A0ABD2YTG7_9GENT